jgi:hypothetical protein
MVAADGGGMVISLTTTINNPWGSYIIVNDTGVILNNQMNDFSVPGTTNGFGYVLATANFIQPRKTPLSSMSPVKIKYLSTHRSTSQPAPLVDLESLPLFSRYCGTFWIVGSMSKKLCQPLDFMTSLSRTKLFLNTTTTMVLWTILHH